MNRATAASGFVSAMKPCPVPRCPQRIDGFIDIARHPAKNDPDETDEVER